MRKRLALVTAVVALGVLFAGCSPPPPRVPPAPTFRLASNGTNYKVACEQCQEIQTGRTDCGNLGSFYVFFDAPAGRTIQSAKVTISWNKSTMSGPQTLTGTVASTDVFDTMTTVCGNSGWVAHIQPSSILTGFAPNAGGNSILVAVTVRYSGETRDSEPMTRLIYFLG
jgi:hypothetical protein